GAEGPRGLRPGPVRGEVGGGAGGGVVSQSRRRPAGRSGASRRRRLTVQTADGAPPSPRDSRRTWDKTYHAVGDAGIERAARVGKSVRRHSYKYENRGHDAQGPDEPWRGRRFFQA